MSELGDVLEERLPETWDEALLLRLNTQVHHGEGLPTASLAIGKDGAVETWCPQVM